MAKDYAKRVFTTTRPRKKNRMRLHGFFVSFLVIASVVGCWMWYVKSTDNAGTKKEWTKKSTLLPIKNPPARPTVHFDFYKELPSVQMNELLDNPLKEAPIPPSVKSEKMAPSPSLDKKGTAYIVELGTYKTSTEASEQRISLLLAGCEAEVVKVSSVYRVQRGPFSSDAQAKKLVKQLQKKGIVGEVKTFTIGGNPA